MWMVDMWNPGVNAKGFYLFLYSLALRTVWFSPLDTTIISTLISKINRVAQGCSSPFLETTRTLSVNAVCSWLEINLELNYQLLTDLDLQIVNCKTILTGILYCSTMGHPCKLRLKSKLAKKTCKTQNETIITNI